MRIAIIALLGLLLAGCFPPKPLPDWAMKRQVEPVARVKAARTVVRQAPDRTAPRSHVTPATPQAEPLPFSPEWQAREDAFDNKLRRTMDICRGC